MPRITLLIEREIFENPDLDYESLNMKPKAELVLRRRSFLTEEIFGFEETDEDSCDLWTFDGEVFRVKKEYAALEKKITALEKKGKEGIPEGTGTGEATKKETEKQ